MNMHINIHIYYIHNFETLHSNHTNSTYINMQSQHDFKLPEFPQDSLLNTRCMYVYIPIHNSYYKREQIIEFE